MYRHYTSRRTLLPAAVALLTGVCLTGCTPTPSPPATSAGPSKLVLGFSASDDADKAVTNLKPLADFLTKELGVPVESFVSTDYTGLVEAMASQKVDIGAFPAFAYVLAKDKNAADVVLQYAQKQPDGSVSSTYRGVFITKASSGLKSITEAKGKRMAWVDATSTSGYLFPAYLLKKQGLDPETFFSTTTNAGSHDNAIRAVYNGDVDVAAIYEAALDKAEKTLPDVKQKLVMLEKTDPIPSSTISVRSGLSPEWHAKIKAAFLTFAKTPAGKATLKTIYNADNLVEAKDSDFDIVRDVAKKMDVPLERFIGKPKQPTPKPK